VVAGDAQGVTVENSEDYHWMLLRLAGRAPDELVSKCRGWLAEGNDAELARALMDAVTSGRARLLDEDVPLLEELLFDQDMDASELVGVDPLTWDSLQGFGFAADRPGSSGGKRQQSHDPAALEAVHGIAGTRALWRAWRVSTDRTTSSPRAVYVVEADMTADLPAITAALQSALSAAGEVDPQVETYPVQADIPAYQRQARGYGELLWSREPDPGVRMAALFDGVDPQTGPYMSSDHPTIDDDEDRAGLLRYLRAGEPLLVTTAVMDDVVDPTRGRRVPMSFRTDGSWIWTDGTVYYLAEHHLIADDELAEHIRELNYEIPDVDGAGLHRAMAKLKEPAPEGPAWTYR
jgi:hypothetical protein